MSVSQDLPHDGGGGIMDRSPVVTYYTMQCTFKLVFFCLFFNLKFLWIFYIFFFLWQTLKAKGKTADLKKLTQVICSI